MAKFCHECGTALGSSSSPAAAGEFAPEVKAKAKRTRKPSAYNKAYAKNYAKLKKKHPRTSFAALAKKAHKMTKRERK